MNDGLAFCRDENGQCADYEEYNVYEAIAFVMKVSSLLSEFRDFFILLWCQQLQHFICCIVRVKLWRHCSHQTYVLIY